MVTAQEEAMAGVEIVLMVIDAPQVQLMAELDQALTMGALAALTMGTVAALTMGALVALSTIDTVVRHMVDLGAQSTTDTEAAHQCAGEDRER